ncbi:MAG: Asp-tRNA(Asn)/Glu-tRNA(Gln) amidotransferase subunit GatA, partial [Rickettsiales bacterium]|nr:Asp-tRNA(Asn)/Glu-tRNA(Gln) amidotransferase subunit GatA [Rickettsiales bacterium]
FEKCDFIICPASSGPAIPLNSDLSPMEYYALDLFTVAMNLSGIPACSVPCGRTGDGLPLGLQVLGRRFDDFSVLHFAREIEKLAALDNRPTRIMGE